MNSCLQLKEKTAMEKGPSDVKEEAACCEIFDTPSERVGPYESSLNGTPYFTKAYEWPLDKENKPLSFLGQINLRECSHGEGSPAEGMLLFFLKPGNSYGQNTAEYRTLYCEEIDMREDSLRTPPEFQPLLSRSYKLSFSHGCHDADLPERVFFEITDDLSIDFFGIHDEFQKTLLRQKIPGHFLGVYGSLQQEEGLLLLEMGQPEGAKAFELWGINGRGRFYISREDWNNRDFTRVHFHWDCFLSAVV